jgi:hypothetical protein
MAPHRFDHDPDRNPGPPRDSGPVTTRPRPLALLAGGDRRSIGRSNEVVRLVLARPALSRELFAGLALGDPVVRLRAADALEKVTRVRPDLLGLHGAALLRLAAGEAQPEVRWHLAQMIPRLALAPAERRTAARIVRRWLADRSRIVQVFALQALADLAKDDPRLRSLALRLVRARMAVGGPAVRARGRRLLRELGEAPAGRSGRRSQLPRRNPGPAGPGSVRGRRSP